MIEEIRKFADSTNFANAVKVTAASVIPVIFFSYIGLFEVGFAMAIGSFLTYPSDIPSNIKHKINGVLVAAAIVAGCNLFVNLLYPIPWLLYPLLAVLLFALSMISVYGHRANMVSFSGLLSAALAFGHLHTGWEIFYYAALIFAGGVFYLVISLLFHYIRPHRYTELQIADCIRLTAKYLKLRGDLWDGDADRAKIIEKQLYLQVDLNTIHENIREILIRNRPESGSTDQNRKMLLVFISLVEIMELALSTSFDHSKLHQKFSGHSEVLKTYQDLAYCLSSTMKVLSKKIAGSKRYTSKHKLDKKLQKLDDAIKKYEAVAKDEDAEGLWMLTNMFHYAEKQIEKIKVIERAFSTDIDLKELAGRDKDLEKFLTPIYYPIATLRENLSFSSTIFRHSLRLTLTILISFIVGSIFPLQNIYWILLTIIVIMRPGYGLTKSRVLQRIVGTIAGGLIAFACLGIIGDKIILGSLAVISMILGFTYTISNYKIGVAFVTMYVVFLYGMLTPNIEQLIGYRIIDTVVAGALAFIASYFFWPSWEFMNAPVYLKKAIESNRDYLSEISLFYNKKGPITTSYKIARKNAFIGVGNLMASYQRMSQEPKSKQKQLAQVYKLAVLNHTLLSSAASLGTYIQSHKTTSASEAFNVVVAKIIQNLNMAVRLLNPDTVQLLDDIVSNKDVALRFTELKEIRSKELRNDANIDPISYEVKMREAQLVIEQLVWLSSLSEKIVKAARQLPQSH